MKTKHKTIKYPKTESQALDIVYKISKEFGFKTITISMEDFEDQMGTERWTKEDYKDAILIATEESCDGIGFCIDEAIIQINNRKN